MERLLKLLEQRQQLYAQADLRITPTRQETPEEVAEQVLEAIPTVLKEGLGVMN